MDLALYWRECVAVSHRNAISRRVYYKDGGAQPMGNVRSECGGAGIGYPTYNPGTELGQSLG